MKRCQRPTFQEGDGILPAARLCRKAGMHWAVVSCAAAFVSSGWPALGTWPGAVQRCEDSEASSAKLRPDDARRPNPKRVARPTEVQNTEKK